MVDSYMRSLRATLQLWVQVFKCEWDSLLSVPAFAYKATPHNITEYGPYLLVTGQNMVLPLPLSWDKAMLSQTESFWVSVL